MHVLIIEDEPAAVNRIKSLLKKVGIEAKVQAELDTVKNAVQWLKTHPAPELVFMDIQLADGLSFEIFEHVEVKAPIIFTTAYNEYALRAFAVNSIDYLLKPLEEEAMRRALQKLEQLRGTHASILQPEQVSQVLKLLSEPFKNRFLVHYGEHIRSIPVADILYFCSREKVTYAVLREGKKYVLDYTMDKVESQTDPRHFFRLNRQYLARPEAIQDIITYSNSRLRVVLLHGDDPDILISREKVSDFKGWLDS
jgi:two-component system, LytTR family, response regulator